MAGHDATLEVSDELLQSALDNGFRCTSDIEEIRSCNFYVVAVPTPVDENHNPDLTLLIGASTTIGKVISKGDVVVYESTVYPGVTEDECIPVVEQVSGLKLNVDFYAGYSPERINPGDKQHTVEHIKKVTSGSTPEVGEYVNAVYSSVITAGTHLASSIKVAEAAKVIENSQRDINIAFVNELAKIFDRMGIDTLDVLEAAGTKWNFLPFRPGLVGGHCIGVDPYYLAQCAQRYGYNPEIILAGRRMNDGMGAYVAEQVVKLCLLYTSLLPTHRHDQLPDAYCPPLRYDRHDALQRALRALLLHTCGRRRYADHHQPAQLPERCGWCYRRYGHWRHLPRRCRWCRWCFGTPPHADHVPCDEPLARQHPHPSRQGKSSRQGNSFRQRCV